MNTDLRKKEKKKKKKEKKLKMRFLKLINNTVLGKAM